MVQGSSWAKRTMAVAIAAAVVTAWAVVGGGAGAALAEGEGAALLEATNASRERHAGAGPLSRVGDLDAIAQRHAEAMAASGGLYHNPELATQVQGWRIVAENVGVGIDIASLHQAFLDSPAHRANVLDARLTELGVGIVVGEGRLWVVAVFRTPLAAAVAPEAVAPEAVAPVAATARSSAPARPTGVAVATAPTAEAGAADARRAAEARAAAAATRAAAEAEADATQAAAEAEAAGLVAAAAAVDLTPQPRYVPPTIALRAPQLVSSVTGAPETTDRPVVLLAGALWLLVAIGLLRRIRSDVVPTSRDVHPLVLRTAAVQV